MLGCLFKVKISFCSINWLVDRLFDCYIVIRYKEKKLVWLIWVKGNNFLEIRGNISNVNLD